MDFGQNKFVMYTSEMDDEIFWGSDFCNNYCKYHNYYDGWCYYYNEDSDLVKDCEYIKKCRKKMKNQFW